MIKFLPLGGAGEIGASCFYLNISGTGILLDCGMNPLKTGFDALPKFDLINNLPLDYVLISHAHQDHISALPFLIQRYPHVKIMSTPQTRAIAELTLHNSVSLLKEQLREDGQANLPNRPVKVYNHEEIDLLIQSIEYKAYGEMFCIEGYKHNGSPIKTEFYDAGHILGAAGILIEYNGKKIFYSGDINLNDQALTLGASLPEENVDILILETTYGATESSSILNWDEEANRFASAINKILIGGGSVLIPVFSLGKIQEIITTLWNLIQKRKLVQTDIYTGGIAQKISRVYDYNRYAVKRSDPEFQISSVPQRDLYEVENIEALFRSPCIVLAPSGMMIEGTASFNLARHWIKQQSSAIFTVGYMEKTTPGYKFANAIKGGKIEINNSQEEVRCSIDKFNFSAHSRREELLEIVRKLKPKTVILIHGDQKAIDWVGSSILKEFKNIKVYQAEIENEIILN